MLVDIQETEKESLEQGASKRRVRDLRLLAITTFCMSFGFGAFSAVVTNFAVLVLHINAKQQGLVESVRETPGFLIVLVAALTMRVAEPILAMIALCLIAIGMAGTAGVNTYLTYVLFSLIWSIGIHSWMTLQPSMALSLADESRRGRTLGQLSAVAGLGTVLGMLMVLFVGKYIGMRNLFLISGSVVGLGAVAVGAISRDIGHEEKPRFVWKRKYSLYYALTFLEGCRKQVFMTFAIFVLVKNYHTHFQKVALLMIINNIANFVLAPHVGKLIDRLGERKVVSFCYAALIPVFIGYARVKSPQILYVLYCLDSLFFLGSMGLNTYLHKIAEPADFQPSVAMGVTANHTAAVVVPLIGGYLWSEFGYPITFYGGAVVVAVSVLTALRIRVEAQTFDSKQEVAIG
jgi:predicted MFS family arabinose efflux permease